MTDIVLDSVQAIVLLGIVTFLWNAGRNRFQQYRTGWNLIISGFGLLLFGSVVDITENFESLNRFIGFGDLEIATEIGEFIGFLGGFIFLAVGFCVWIPKVQGLSDLVDTRSRELEETNTSLVIEVEHRTQAEEILRASEARFRFLIENTNIIPWEADAATFQFTYVGPQAERHLGYPIEDWYRNDFWLDRIHPDDKEAALASCVSALARGEDNDFEYRMIAADGRIVWLRDIVSVVMGEDGPKTLRGILVNITSRKNAEAAALESEEKYRTLVETSHDLIWSVDIEGRFTFVNQAAKMIHGYEPAEMIGKRFTDFMTKEQANRDMAVFAEIKDGKDHFDMETTHLKKDGSPVHLSFNAVVSRDADGNVLGTQGTAKNISDRVRADEVARLHQAELAHVTRVRTMGEMAASLAHELNQPLTAAMNYIDGCLLRQKSGEQISPTIIDALGKASAAIHRAGDIIRRIRTFIGKVEHRVDKLSINEAIRVVADMMRSELQLTQIELRLDLNETDPIIAGDQILIQQVILNLARNGMEALEKVKTGPKKLTISTAKSASDVTVVITDTGPGVAPDQVAHLFEPFRTDKEGGLGMGLVICRSVIESHGGQIWFEPATERGAAFNIQLPSTP